MSTLQRDRRPSGPVSSDCNRLRDRFGVCQWFHYNRYAHVEKTVALLKELGVRHLRTGISWADFHRPHGKAWYDWQMAQLKDFDVLLSVWHTPPSLAEGNVCNGPPKRLEDYSDFIEQIIEEYGDSFSHLELWNEPNNRYKWDFVTYDPQWEKFGKMVATAGKAAKRRGKPTVLGGMIPVDPDWLKLMRGYGALEGVDIVAIHAFPGMWWEGSICWESREHWDGWSKKIAYIRAHAEGRPIWITETGLATLDFPRLERARYDMQVRMLRQAVTAPADRTYWYCLTDLSPQLEAIEGFHVDENEYHLGLLTHDGQRKPAFDALKDLLA